MTLLSQVLNGMLLPFILIFMILLINKRALMKEWVNPRVYNFVAWATVIIVIGMTLALTSITIRNPS
jgi:Mn2+/Fe2+ NRAMP family transporter